MKLSSEILISRLSGRFVFDFVGKQTSKFIFSRPVFLTKNTQPQNGQILIGKFRQIDKLPQKLLQSILITQKPLIEEVKSQFECILIFDKQENLNEVVNFIHDIFNIYDEWMIDLSQMTNHGYSLTKIFDHSLNVFGNPLMLTDSNMQLSAYSSIIDASPKLAILLEQANSPELPNTYVLSKEFRDTFSIQKANYFTSNYTGIQSAYKNIFLNGKNLYRIVLPEVLRELQDSDLVLLDILGEYIQNILGTERENERTTTTLANLFLHILKQEPLETHIFKRTLQFYQWTDNCTYLCLKFKVHHLDRLNQIGMTIIQYLEKKIEHCCALEFEQNIVVYINLTLNQNAPDDILHDIKEFICNQNLRVGVSNPHSYFTQCFLLLYKQADTALKTGNHYTPFRWIHRFSDIYDKYLFEQCVSEFPVDMICSPEILDIYYYDEKHNSEYLYTLKVYLENNMQPGKTSEKLFVHRTTFLYRIEKLVKKFQINLEDPHKRLLYQLSIALLADSKNFSTTNPS